MAINTCTISGNLTRDSELAWTKNGGTPVLSFCVAVDEGYKNSEGEWVKTPAFIDCTMFGSRANSLHKYLMKGTHLTVQGKLRYSTWEKEGQKRHKLDVLAQEVDFRTSERREQQAEPPAEPGNEASPYPGDAGYYDSEIPF